MKVTNEQLDGLIKSAVNSSGPLPNDDKFSQIISALRELRELRAAMLQGSQPVTTAYKLPDWKTLDTVKFNADCALQDPESIYAQEFFMSLDEAFGERGNYTEPVQAKAVSMLIAEIFRLQGKAEPVSNRDELPLNYLQGHKDGLEWAAQLAEADQPLTGDWLYDEPTELAKAIRKGPEMPPVNAGSSPVIPDGWIKCSERMPEEGAYISAVSRHGEYVAGQVSDSWLDLHDGTTFSVDEVYLWMPLPPLPAAPQQQES